MQPQHTSTSDRRPRVVMLLANRFEHDTRVYKQARSLIAWGCEVHVIALAGRDLPDEEVLDGIHVHRIPVGTRDEWRLAVAVLFWWLPPVLRLVVRPESAGCEDVRRDPEAGGWVSRIGRAVQASWRALVAALRGLGAAAGAGWRWLVTQLKRALSVLGRAFAAGRRFVVSLAVVLGLATARVVLGLVRIAAACWRFVARLAVGVAVGLGTVTSRALRWLSRVARRIPPLRPVARAARQVMLAAAAATRPGRVRLKQAAAGVTRRIAATLRRPDWAAPLRVSRRAARRLADRLRRLRPRRRRPPPRGPKWFAQGLARSWRSRVVEPAARVWSRLLGWGRRRFPTSLRLLLINIGLARRALALEPDAVEAHDLNTLFGGTLVKRLTGAGLVYDSHELYLQRNIADGRRIRANLVWAPIEQLCIRRCDAVMSVAKGICVHLRRQYRIPEPRVLRNVQPYESTPPRTGILARELGIDPGVRIVIYPGAITINRGLEVLIDSAALLDGAVYVIMGYARNPAYLESLRQRAAEAGVLSTKVHFRDAVPINDVVRYVASADLGIVPTRNVCLSYYFESSNKIFHCVMAGVPLAMSNHYEKRLLAEEHGIGVLFDETDPRDIARTVNATLADREAYDRMCRNCRIAARVLNWEHEEQVLWGTFAEVLGEDLAPPVPPLRVPDADAAEVATVSGAGTGVAAALTS